MSAAPHSLSTKRLLIAILLVAVALRLAWRIHLGNEDFWANGYSFFYELGVSLASGNGFVLGDSRAMRVPLYPVFLALMTLAGKYYLWVVVPQSLMGAGTVWCTYAVARDLFGERSGLLAATVTALYPYYVVHDTALQETGMFTFLTTAAMLLLLRAMRGGGWKLWCFAGAVLAMAVLTRQTLLPFALCALAWIACFSEGDRARKWKRAAIVAAPVVIMVGGWVARNYAVVGAPVITSELGFQLWNGNNSKTFSRYPAESIDRSADEALASLSQQHRVQLDALGGNEVAENDWFLRKAAAYIRDNPVAALHGAARKLWATFSWRFSPRRESLAEWILLLSYGPVCALGVYGMWATRERWRELGLIYLLFLTFAAVTGLFFGHTSHRSYLDLWWVVCGAGMASDRLIDTLRGNGHTVSGGSIYESC
ncbi:MAG: glycosyltransferase family 39 protein [Bryobacteraceae bacterium]